MVLIHPAWLHTTSLRKPVLLWMGWDTGPLREDCWHVGMLLSQLCVLTLRPHIFAALLDISPCSAEMQKKSYRKG